MSRSEPLESGQAARSAARSRRRLVAAVAAAALVLAWWWWPSLVDRAPGPGGDPSARAGANDILVVGDGDLVEAATPLARRLRERGFSVVEDYTLASWCAAADGLDDLIDTVRPATVVVSFRAEGTCGDGVLRTVASVGERRAVLVVQPGSGRQEPGVRALLDGLAADNVTVADPSRMLGGEEMPAVVGCQWWDDCSADGTVEIRSPDGTLTPAGGERIARVLVGLVD